MIRPAEREDLESIVDLHVQVFGPPVGFPSEDLLTDYARGFFDNPWYDPNERSLLYERDGQVKGFVGLMVRPMECGDREIRAAVPTKFMAEQGKEGALIAVQLIRALHGMSFDLAVNDRSNREMRDLWVRAGAELFLPSTVQWVKLFKPAQDLRRRAERRGGLTRLGATLGSPLSYLADVAVERAGWNDFSGADSLRAHPVLDPATLLTLIQNEGAKRRIRPIYTLETLGWQLSELRRMARFRELRGSVVLDDRGKELGWFVYYLRKGGLSEVLQLVARSSMEERLLSMLFAENRRLGAVGVEGRIDPRFLPALEAFRCTFKAGDPWSLVFTKDQEIQAELQSGKAFFSRLEGEWW